MIDASKLPGTPPAADQTGRSGEVTSPALTEQAPGLSTGAGATYPAKNLVLENGHYRVADHEK